MNQSLPAANPELPKPIEPARPIQSVELDSVTATREKDAMPLQADRLSAANRAVNRVADTTQRSNPASSTQDNSATSNNPVASSTTNLSADDVDVIEKVWVQKAKAVVNDTKDDPQKQSVGLSHVKHDYLSKRFNKDLKLPNG